MGGLLFRDELLGLGFRMLRMLWRLLVVSFGFRSLFCSSVEVEGNPNERVTQDFEPEVRTPQTQAKLSNNPGQSSAERFRGVWGLGFRV